MTESDRNFRTSPARGLSPTAKRAAPAELESVKDRRRKKPLAVVGVIVTLGAVCAGWLMFSSSAGIEAPADFGQTATVVRGTLVYSATESGEVEAERRKVIGNELRYPAIIKKVVPEGTSVKEGDVVIEFECKELIDDIEKARITVTAAENAFTQARENLILKQKEMDAALRTAAQAVIDANSDLRKYIEIEGPTKLDDANSAIATAQQDLLLAQAKLDFKLKVNADAELKSPFSKNDIEAEKLAVRRLELAQKKADNTRLMLMKYDHPRQIQKYETVVENARLAMARAELESRSQRLKAEADLAAMKATFEMQDRKLTDLLEDANKIEIKADKEGLVVYDTGGNRWYSSEVRVEVGAKINPRQQLMIIPDLTTLQIRTKVYEAMVDDVRPGLVAHVKLENKPDQMFTGKVLRVGVLPDSQNRWLNPGVKVFSVIVKLDQEIDGLRPGMSTEVEIELARLDHVMNVPIASIFSEGGKTFCYRVSNGQYKRAEVVLGRMNSMQAQIISGLHLGDKVLLAPPKGERVDLARPKEEDEEADAPGSGKQRSGKSGKEENAKPGGDEGGRKAPSEGVRKAPGGGAGKQRDSQV